MQKFEVCWSKGVGFRNSPDFEDKTGRIAQNGQVVLGTPDVRGEWLLEAGTDQYLPMRGPKNQQLCRPTWDDSTPDDLADPIQGAPQPQPPQMNELDLLHSKGDSKFGKPKGVVNRARPTEDTRGPRHAGNELQALQAMNQSKFQPPTYSAATSHRRNDQYMADFEQALREKGVDASQDPYLHPEVHAVRPEQPLKKPLRLLKPVSNSTRQDPSSGGSSASNSKLGSLTTKPSNAIVPETKQWTSVKHGREVLNTSSSGRCTDLSDRNLLCCAALGGKVVFGGADHQLKEVDAASGSVKRKLYTKSFGHTDWVTTVDCVPDGKILSGGSDSKLCLWNATGQMGVELRGHTGSVSKVKCIDTMACSASYDKTLRLWDLVKKREVATLMGHTAAVLDFVWSNGCDWIGSGDRGGTCRLFDVGAATCVSALKGHKGHITSISTHPTDDDALWTGAQDGTVRQWDTRQRLNKMSLGIHTGAVNDIGFNGDLIVTAGADQRLVCMDLRQHSDPLWERPTADFIYSMLARDDVVLTGDGRGTVVCHDWNGNQKYCLQAATNAIRCIVEAPTCLVVGGDDGNAIFYDY